MSKIVASYAALSATFIIKQALRMCSLGGRNILRPYFAGYILIADNKLRQSVCGDEFVEESAVVLGE